MTTESFTNCELSQKQRTLTLRVKNSVIQGDSKKPENRKSFEPKKYTLKLKMTVFSLLC